jgi:pilus assembly protein CpaD
MVANPADLLGPRTQGDRHSPRRDEVFDKYSRGASSASQRTGDERVNTSDLSK